MTERKYQLDPFMNFIYINMTVLDMGDPRRDCAQSTRWGPKIQCAIVYIVALELREHFKPFSFLQTIKSKQTYRTKLAHFTKIYTILFTSFDKDLTSKSKRILMYKSVLFQKLKVTDYRKIRYFLRLETCKSDKQSLARNINLTLLIYRHRIRSYIVIIVVK